MMQKVLRAASKNICLGLCNVNCRNPAATRKKDDIVKGYQEVKQPSRCC
jgi:hypothetical protein